MGPLTDSEVLALTRLAYETISERVVEAIHGSKESVHPWETMPEERQVAWMRGIRMILVLAGRDDPGGDAR